MTMAVRLYISLIAFSASLGFQGPASAQSRETNATPNSLSQVSHKTSTDSIFIADVLFDGLHALPASDVLKEFRERRAGLKNDDPFLLENAQKGAAILKELLADSGYMNASVEVLIVDVSRSSKRITYAVDEGPPSVIREIHFEGNKVFTEEELRSQLKLVSEMSHNVFDRATLKYDLNNSRIFMRSRGYLQARVLEPKINSLNGNVTIVVPVEEGRLYRVGRITVLGSVRYSPEQIIEMIGLKKGDIADGKRISDFLFDELETLYLNMGYLHYSASPDPEFKDNPKLENEAIVDFQITIDEGACYKIGSIEFRGSKKLTEQQLRSVLLFKEGDTYNEQLIRDSLRNLSEIELLNPVDREADVKYLLDEDTHLVKIIINVRENEE